MPETLEIPIDSIKEWTDKQSTPIVDPLRKSAKRHLADLKSKLEELLDGCEKLLDDADKEIAKGSRKTYRRAKALHKLADNFAGLIEEIKLPDDISGKILKQTSEQIGKTLQTISIERAKWFRAISPYFILTRRRFEVSLKRAEDSYKNFAEFVTKEYVKADDAENISSRIEELHIALAQLKEVQTSKETRKEQKKSLEKSIIDVQQSLESIQTKDEVIELAQLNKEIGHLTEKVRHELRHIQKPLLKFQTLISGPGYSLTPDANQKLDEYLTDPFKALATEKDGYPLLKTVVQKMTSALDNKKVKLKSSRLRKAQEQIDSILNGTNLVSLQQSCRDALSRKNALATSGAISETIDKRAELQEELKDLQRKKKALENRDLRFEKDLKDARARVEEYKTKLEKIVSELSDKDVRVVFE
ncbi:MAG: hypothetical protein NWF03_08925 [Candidatus Bathyarchaeota archaeon]|nr:hypothetical protein [Candidatus Bathyarchaeota archaeon]